MFEERARERHISFNRIIRCYCLDLTVWDADFLPD